MIGHFDFGPAARNLNSWLRVCSDPCNDKLISHLGLILCFEDNDNGSIKPFKFIGKKFLTKKTTKKNSEQKLRHQVVEAKAMEAEAMRLEAEAI